MSLQEFQYVWDEAVPEDEALEKLSSYLEDKFEYDLMEGLGLGELLLRGPEFDNFDDFFTYMRRTVKTCACQTAWNRSTLAVKCKQCSRTENSCICLQCFLAGDHEGHDVRLSHSSTGNCDCGDESMWLPSGFCKNHCGRSPHPELDLKRRLRIVLIAITTGAFKNLGFHARYDKHSFLLTIKWLLRFVYLGDATRRCVVIGMQRAMNFFDFITSVYPAENSDFKELCGFLGFLVNDSLFLSYMRDGVVPRFPELVRLHMKFATFKDAELEKAPLSNSINIMKMIFHVFVMPALVPIIDTIDWVKIVIDSLRTVHSFVSSSMRFPYYRKFRMIFIQSRLCRLIEAGVSRNDASTNERFASELATFLADYVEFNWLTQREFGDAANDQEMSETVVEYFSTVIYKIIGSFNGNFFSKAPLQRLITFLDSHKYDNAHKSVLEQGVQFGSSYFLHILAFGCLFLKNVDVAEVLQAETDNVDLLLRQWAMMPVRYYLACELSNYGFFVRNKSTRVQTMMHVKSPYYFKNEFLPTFRMIQGLLLLTRDTDAFVQMIAEISGVLLDFEETRKRHNVFHIFLHFVCCLVYNRDVLENDFFKMRRLSVMTELKLHPLSPEAIEELWYGSLMDDNAFAEDLLTFSERVVTDRGAVFKLTDDSEWHPLLPFVELPTILEILTDLVRKNPLALISFPPLPPELKGILVCPIMMAVYYDFLSDPEKNQEFSQVVFNMLIGASLSYPDGEEEPEDGITAESLSGLAEKLQGVPFRKFIHTKISYMGRDTASLFNLIIGAGDIGLVVAKRLSLNLGVIPDNTKLQKQLAKERSLAMKQKILMSMQEKKDRFEAAFSNGGDSPEDENEVCSVCHLPRGTELLLFPAFIFPSVIPSIAEHQHLGTTPESYSRSNIVKICLHQFHPACEGRRVFQCPIDRCVKNAGLPEFKDGYEPLTDPTAIESVDKFLSIFQRDDSIVTLVQDFASHIELLELRYRSNPNCLDKKAVGALLRNLYLCIWHRRRTQAEFILDDDSTYPPFITLILLKLACGTSEFDFARIVGIVSGHRPPLDRYIFLRRAALFQHFCLGNSLFPDGAKHDWDAILSLEHLLELYRIEPFSLTADLPPFRIIYLPDNYLGFMKPPFEINIASNQDFEIGVCLFTGEHCVVPKSHEIIKGLQTHRKLIARRLGDTYTFMIMVTGPRATSVVIADNPAHRTLRSRSCYLDKFGDENSGLRSNRVVTLSQDRVRWVIDQILSSDWTSQIPWRNVP